MSPKKRTSRNLPKHIAPDADKLPTGVWFNPSGKLGHWRLNINDNLKKTSVYLCQGDANLAELYKHVEQIKTHKTVAFTFRTLAETFQSSHYWPRLRPNTQSNYLSCHKKICTVKIKTGELGDAPVHLWTKGTVRDYRDKRAKDISPGVANMELAYIKRVFSYGFEYEHIKENVTLGIKPLPTEKRSHKIDMAEYNFFISVAKQQAAWYIWVVAEITLGCRARLNEVLAMTEENATPEGLIINRLKRSRDGLIRWSPRLKAAFEFAVKTSNANRTTSPFRKDSRYLIVSSKTHDRLTDAGFQRAWLDAMALAQTQAQKTGFEFRPFQHRDLKKLAITTDTAANKQTGAGHKSAFMTDYYDLSRNESDSII